MATFPSVFISHGSPMVAIQEGQYHDDLAKFFSAMPKPNGIVVISPHWITPGEIQVTGARDLDTIHDYRGFPRELYEVEYPVQGSPELALQVVSLLGAEKIPATLNSTRGLDHGAWTPIRIAYPQGDVPVVQVSMPLSEAADVLRMGKALRNLRSEGILILGSGGVVHNLGDLSWSEISGKPYDWAQEFDDWVFECLKTADIQSLLDMENPKAHPTPEHFYPLLFTLGASLPGDRLAVLHRGFQYRSLSMSSFALVGPV